MNGNLLSNCGGLELVAGWEAVGGVLSLDEAALGAAGRAVFVATRMAGVGAGLTVRTAMVGRAAVIAGAELEVIAHVVALNAGQPVGVALDVVFFNDAGVEIGRRPIAPAPAVTPRHGEGLYGLRTTFRRAFDRITAPAGGVRAGLEVTATATMGGELKLGVLKPMIAMAQPGRGEPLIWDPGLHTSPDLQRPRWPSILGLFAAGPGAEPQPDRIEFTAPSARPMARRTSRDAVRKFSAPVRCDMVQRAALEVFHRSVDDFWFLEPDTDRLCLASFTSDGAPRMTDDRGEVALVTVGLWLETA